MTIPAGKNAKMTVYSSEKDIESHRVRIVLAEKAVSVEILSVDEKELPQELLELNPHGSLPTLVDRDLVLYRASIISEYLDERFPHPPLLAVYPVVRAQSRLLIYRIENDWYTLAHKILNSTPAVQEKARKELQDGIMSLAPIFEEYPYFFSEDFTLVDCCLSALLWRLPLLGVKLDEGANAIHAYCKRVFERNSFLTSLTDAERDMR